MAETLPLVATLEADLRRPPDAHAIVVVAHDDSVRDQAVRDALHDARFATIQIDLKPAGDGPPTSTVAVRWLTRQLIATAGWIAGRPDLEIMPIGIFGSHMAGGAALAAAAACPNVFRALVLRDGQPNAAGSTLNEVLAATLLIVDGQDDTSIKLNQETMTRVKGIAELEIIPASPADTEDSEAIAQVARLTRRWFARFLA